MTKTLETFSQDVKAYSLFLQTLLKKPLMAFAQMPSMPWPSALTLHTLLALPLAFLLSVFQDNTSLASILYHWLLSLILLTISIVFIYHSSFLFFKKKLTLTKLVPLVLTVFLPYLCLHPFMVWVPPIDLITLAVGCLWLIIGLVEALFMRREDAIKIAGLLYFSLFVSWSLSLLSAFG